MKFDATMELLPRIASGFIRLLYATLRVRHWGLERIESLNRAGKNYIVSFWHAHLLLMVYCRHRKPISVMISQSRDGELIARTMQRFSVDAVRGSSSRGGTGALRQIVRLGEERQNIAFTPDGPRGPRRIAQIGVVAAAQATGLPIVPVLVSSKKKSF